MGIKDMKDKVSSEEMEEELKYWKEEAGRLRNKLNSLENPTTQETSPTETFMGGDDSMFSTLSETRVHGDLSTTGGLGDNEGMDSTIAHADPDPEEMLSSSEPWPEPRTQRNKRRRMID